MIVETFLVCATVFFMCAPMAYAKAHEIRERAHKLEAENDALDYIEMHRDPSGHE